MRFLVPTLLLLGSLGECRCLGAHAARTVGFPCLGPCACQEGNGCGDSPYCHCLGCVYGGSGGGRQERAPLNRVGVGLSCTELPKKPGRGGCFSLCSPRTFSTHPTCLTWRKARLREGEEVAQDTQET